MTLSIRLQDDYMNRLDYLAKKTNRPKTFYVKELFNRHFDELEDIYLAETALEEFKKSGEKTISLDEMRTELGLDD
ncbi:MAG: CopG family transcriptional regulator [Deltaproteobacteria bacterium]|nr:CopG family transcriptional regulator [Deltaproteobacteria bacterium]